MRATGAPVFANPEVLVRSWYVVAPVSRLNADRPRTFEVLGRRITLWHDGDGRVRAFDARCPHLGADLGLGRIVGGTVRCAFHHWRFAADGSCVESPGQPHCAARRATCYPVRERHGLIWIHNGDDPSFEVPRLPDDDPDRYRRWVPRARHIGCHPHLVIGNGLDVTHFGPLHGMSFSCPPTLEAVGERSLRLDLRGRPVGVWTRRLTGTRRAELVASFTVVGPNIAWLSVAEPVRFHVLFTGRPTPEGHCDTQTVMYLPRGLRLDVIRSVALLFALLHDDHAILDRLDFHRGFGDGDEPLRRFAEMVDAMEVEP